MRVDFHRGENGGVGRCAPNFAPHNKGDVTRGAGRGVRNSRTYRQLPVLLGSPVSGATKAKSASKRHGRRRHSMCSRLDTRASPTCLGYTFHRRIVLRPDEQSSQGWPQRVSTTPRSSSKCATQTFVFSFSWFVHCFVRLSKCSKKLARDKPRCGKPLL